MNLRRIFSQVVLVMGAVLFSIGLQTFAAFTEPATSPPSSDVYAPLNTGPSMQTKQGGILLNAGGALNGLIVQSGNVGIGTENPTAKLHVAGNMQTDGGVKIGDDTSACTEANKGTLRSVNGSLQACGNVTVYISGNSVCNDKCTGGVYYGDLSLYGDCKVYACGWPRQQLEWGTVQLNP